MSFAASARIPGAVFSHIRLRPSKGNKRGTVGVEPTSFARVSQRPFANVFLCKLRSRKARIRSRKVF